MVFGPLAAVNEALGEVVIGVDVDSEGDRGNVFVVFCSGNAQVVGSVANGKIASAQLGESMKGVGGVVDGEVDFNALD